MLSGEHEITMDDKGRVIVPTRFREELGSDVVLWRGFDGQIVLHPKLAWQEAINKLAQQATQEYVREARWLLLSGNPAELDRQGRVVIPPSLRRHAELGTEVVVVGIEDHLEIWSLARWDEKTRAMQADAGKIANALASVGIRI
jgi:MraZ protein